MTIQTYPLVITCFGRAEFPEDDPFLGTYWTEVVRPVGRCFGIAKALRLAERQAAKDHFRLLGSRRRFAPERIVIRDSRDRLVLGGRVLDRRIEWYEPVRSDQEAEVVRTEASTLNGEAAYERGWDNFSTAGWLNARADLLETRLVDPVWRVEALTALQSHNLNQTRQSRFD